MENVMDRKVTEVLKESGDYFAALVEGGIAYGIVGTYIVFTPNEADIKTLTEASKLDDMDFEAFIDVLLLKNV